MPLADNQSSFSVSDITLRKGWRKLRILVVDDQWDTVQTLQAIFQHAGYDCWGLYRAGHVIAGVKSFIPDVVILDIALPDGSGYLLADQIRQLPGKRPLLIAITGIYKPSPDATRFDHFFTKPFAVSDLLDLIAPLACAREQS